MYTHVFQEELPNSGQNITVNISGARLPADEATWMWEGHGGAGSGWGATGPLFWGWKENVEVYI